MWTALSQFEGQLLLWIQEGLRQPWLDPIVAFYTRLGDHGLVWIAACLLMLLWPKTRRAGWAGIFALLLSLLCTNILLKHIFTRPRPWLVLEGLLPVVVERDPNSFPSGHSSAALASAAAWWRYLPKPWRRVGMACGLLMALSRLYVGVHFPSDVLCGILVGLFCGWGGWQLERLWEGKWNAGE
ncbi:MAG: phosphatase PAP2 family protein [Oscillospiraceae bacterium]|jgi:membrane-associated phospholipid phosphatase|nr:phosphatase PAP2 family protein [Oscillospiraceae bacterium]